MGKFVSVVVFIKEKRKANKNNEDEGDVSSTEI